MDTFIFDTQDFILYLLSKLEPDKSTKLALNKIAFFVEFGYLFKKSVPLSNAEYAGINLGPIINDYSDILSAMEKEGKIKIDGNIIRPLEQPSRQVPAEIASVIDPLIEKYSNFNLRELVALSHSTDSYKITTDNEKVMGNIIDKDLAQLETFYSENLNEELNADELPTVKFEDLEPYDVG